MLVVHAAWMCLVRRTPDCTEPSCLPFARSTGAAGRQPEPVALSRRRRVGVCDDHPQHGQRLHGDGGRTAGELEQLLASVAFGGGYPV